MDGVELEILWSNLIGIVTERAKALQRIAFSPVVREAGDLACALFDRRGRMVASTMTNVAAARPPQGTSKRASNSSLCLQSNSFPHDGGRWGWG